MSVCVPPRFSALRLRQVHSHDSQNGNSSAGSTIHRNVPIANLGTGLPTDSTPQNPGNTPKSPRMIFFRKTRSFSSPHHTESGDRTILPNSCAKVVQLSAVISMCCATCAQIIFSFFRGGKKLTLNAKR